MVTAALLGLLLAAPFEAPIQIDAVRVEGSSLTLDEVVLRELAFSVPGEVTPAAWDLSEKRLWNLGVTAGVFSRVDLILEVTDAGNTALIRLEDRIPAGPVFRFNFGGGRFYLWLGAAYGNVAGRAIEARAFYERFDAHDGFSVSITDPRFLGERLSLSLQGEWLCRPRPDFVMRRLAVRLVAEWSPPWWPSDNVRPLLKVEGNSDTFPFAATDRLRLSPSMALVVTPGVRLGRVDTIRLRQEGFSIEPRVALGWTTEPSDTTSVKADLEAYAYVLMGSRLNLASRLLVGALSGVRTQDRFYIGGLDLVRGYLDSEVRATAWGIANLELRVVAFDSTWFAVIPVVFVDAGVAHPDSGGEAWLASAGAGLRLFVPRLPRFAVRLEGSLTLAPTEATRAFAPGFNFGIYHFF
ncbi:MAG: BamA/TamA family outer membrane protein [Myxococcales bacterium]